MDNVSYSNPVDLLSENEGKNLEKDNFFAKPMNDSIKNSNLSSHIHEENYSNPIDLITSTQPIFKRSDDLNGPTRPDFLEIRGPINRPHSQR